MAGIIDRHAHYDDPALDIDRDALLAQVGHSTVTKIINIGDSPSS